MAHEAPTTKEDTILESLKQLSEIELQSILSQLGEHLDRHSQDHIYKQAFELGNEDLLDEIFELEQNYESINTANERLIMNLATIRVALEEIREIPTTEGIDKVIKIIK